MSTFNRPGAGRGAIGGFLNTTPILRAIVYANVGMFLFGVFFGKLRISGVPVDDYIFRFLYLWPLKSGNFYPWQLISYMFLHGSFSHIFFNMLALWMFGAQFELIWGPKKFLTFYFLCGLGGGLAHLLISPLFGASGPLLGASGAVFGLLIAYGLLYPDNLVFLFFFFPLKAKYAIGLFVAFELWSLTNVDGIGHFAHLGGAVVGLIYILSTSGGMNIFSNFRSHKRPDDENYWGSRPTGGGIFRRRPTDDDDAIDAEYHEIGGTATKTRGGARVITQEDIDRILDKIAASGYQNLSEEEREILIEASRKMDGRS